MTRAQRASLLERFGTTLFGVRHWMVQTWRIGFLLGKGAYLLGERRRVLMKLGEEVYGKYQAGEIEDPSLKPMVDQLDRMTKKVKIEEMLIQRIRFGGKAARTRRDKKGNPNAAPGGKGRRRIDGGT